MVGLIDGPVAISHSDLAGQSIREVPGAEAACTRATSLACLHGTFVAPILCAKRGSSAPAICPSCTLLVRPVFAEAVTGNLESPSAEPEELAVAILACVEARAKVINLSIALMQSSLQAKLALLQALDHAAMCPEHASCRAFRRAPEAPHKAASPLRGQKHPQATGFLSHGRFNNDSTTDSTVDSAMISPQPA
jgi:hypothetical protein